MQSCKPNKGIQLSTLNQPIAEMQGVLQHKQKQNLHFQQSCIYIYASQWNVSCFCHKYPIHTCDFEYVAQGLAAINMPKVVNASNHFLQPNKASITVQIMVSKNWGTNDNESWSCVAVHATCCNMHWVFKNML